jgi:hypothetical protein
MFKVNWILQFLATGLSVLVVKIFCFGQGMPTIKQAVILCCNFVRNKGGQKGYDHHAHSSKHTFLVSLRMPSGRYFPDT